MQNLMQMGCSTHSVVLNVISTQHTCSLNSTYHPHCLVHGGHHCSCTCLPGHSPWLPGYIDVVHTVLIILIMAGLFPDRPHKLIYSFKLVFWVSLDKFPEFELLLHKAVPFLIVSGISILLSTVVAPVCIPTTSAQGSPLSIPLPALVC